MILNYLEDLLDKMKTFINNSKSVNMNRIFLILVWVFCVGIMIFTTIGRAILTFFACIFFVYFLTDILYDVYKNVSKDFNSEEVIQSSEKIKYPRKVYGPTEKATAVLSANPVKIEFESCCHPYYIEDVESNVAKTYYILDTSVFFEIQEYTTKRGYCVSDILYGNFPMNDNLSYLAKIIGSRQCYVTYEILDEVKNAENQHKLQRGVADFVEEDIGVWYGSQNYMETDNLIVPVYGESDKRPRLKYHKLVLDAVMLSKTKNCDVIIITSSHRVISLAEANHIKVIAPNKIKQEE